MKKTNGKTKGNVASIVDDAPAPLVAWAPSSHLINIPANEAEYNELVAVLDYLLDTSDPDEQSPASALVDMIGSLIESYENIHVPARRGESRDANLAPFATERQRSGAFVPPNSQTLL